MAYLVEDAVKGVASPPGSMAQAVPEMKQAGIKVIQAAEVANLK